MTLKSVTTAVLASAAFALAACGEVDLAAYEREEFSACYADGGAWAGEDLAARYVEGGFDDLDRHFARFLDDFEQAAGKVRSQSRADWPTLFAPLHEAAQANIVRLGRLLPRMNRPLDLAPMTGQFEERAIWWPRGDHHTEFLGVALAQEFAGHQNLADHIATFLSHFEGAEALLLDLKYAEVGDSGADLPSAQDVARTARQLREDWEEGVRPGMMRVIFDRPDMPVGESLSERLQTRVTAICDSYAECGDGEYGCGGGAASDGLTGEPMDAGS